MEYKTGQVVKSRVEEAPFLYHFGIVAIKPNGDVTIMHNTIDEDVIREPLDTYLEDRVIEEVFETELMELPDDELYHRFIKCKGDFNAVNYNCEHFIDCMLGHEQNSEQLRTILLYTLLGVVVYKVLR
mgnify:CR=1 FL=1